MYQLETSSFNIKSRADKERFFINKHILKIVLSYIGLNKKKYLNPYKNKLNTVNGFNF